MSETADFKRLKLFDPVDGSKNIINSNFLSCNNDKEKDYMDDKKDMQSLNIDDYISLKYGPSEKKVIVPHKTPHKIKNVIYLKQTYSTKANNSHKAVVGLSKYIGLAKPQNRESKFKTHPLCHGSSTVGKVGFTKILIPKFPIPPTSDRTYPVIDKKRNHGESRRAIIKRAQRRKIRYKSFKKNNQKRVRVFATATPKTKKKQLFNGKLVRGPKKPEQKNSSDFRKSKEKPKKKVNIRSFQEWSCRSPSESFIYRRTLMRRKDKTVKKMDEACNFCGIFFILLLAIVTRFNVLSSIMPLFKNNTTAEFTHYMAPYSTSVDFYDIKYGNTDIFENIGNGLLRFDILYFYFHILLITAFGLTCWFLLDDFCSYSDGEYVFFQNNGIKIYYTLSYKNEIIEDSNLKGGGIVEVSKDLYKRKQNDRSCDKSSSSNDYSNLNLNQNNKCPQISMVSTPNKLYNSNNSDGSTVSDINEKQKLQDWNKPSEPACRSTFSDSLTMNGNVEAGPKTYLNNDKLSEDTINQKMLSLHIGVVENEPYPAASNSFGKSEKRVDLKRFAIRNSFEFRRQQNDKAKESEISHFKASQKLIFDDPLPQSTRSSSEGEESEDESDEPVNFFNHSDGEENDSDNNQNSQNESDDETKQNNASMDVDESDDDSLNDDGKSDDSMNGRESDNEDEQLDDTEVEEFNYDSPQKTSNKIGIIAENAHEKLSYFAARKLIKLAVNNAEYFYGSVPMVFPEAGVIIAVNLADVQEKYGLKTESDAMSEMRTDGYCWHFQGKYTNQDTKITRSYWYAKDDKGDPTKSFQRYQFVYKNRYMLLHYIGNELYASDGLPHGNAVRKTNAYRKTRKSSLLKMLKASKKTLPNRTWELWKKSGGDLGLVTDPRDKEQLKNRRRLVQRISRFGKNTLFNLSILGSELLYIINNQTYYFVTYLNLAEFNVCLHVVAAPLIEEMCKTMSTSDVVSQIYIDTGFEFGPYYLSTLSWKHPYFNKPVILAAYLHDRKARPGHRFFFDEIYRNYERFFKKIKGRFLLVTDAEFNFLHCWIYLNHVHCYRHQKKNLEWNLKQAKCKQIVKCLKLLDDVQDQETTEECDEAIAKAMAEIPSGEDRLIFAKIANKVKESSRAGLLRQYGSTERKLTSNIAEIVNSLIKSKKKKKSVEADEMVCLLFYTTNNYHRDILRGYYGEGDFSLLPAFGNKKLGSPKMLKEIQLPWAPSPDGICDFLRNESQLPWDNSMKMERPLTLKDDQRKSSITTIVAQDIVETGDVHNPAPGYFLVIDKARKCHAVKLNSKNLDDYKYYCSCNPDRTCIHIKAALLYLKLDPTVIPDFGEGDAVEDRRKRRPSTQGGPGFKQPRLVDKKDERDAEKEDDNNNEDDKNGHKKDSKSGKKVKSKAQEEENRRKAAALIDDENEQTEKAVKTNYLADKFPPPPQLPESSYPSWWNRLAVTVENILFHFEIFLPTFERPLKNLPVGKACIFQSHKEKFVLIYRKGNDEITAYVASHLLDPDSVKEIAFTAAQCFRDASSSTVNVRGFYADNSEQNDNPLFLLLLKLHVLKENENPEEYAFNFTYFDDEFTEESINQLLNNKKSVNPAINEFEKIEKVELLCCCKRAYFRCSELRSKALKLQQTIKCDTCNKEYFQRCVNASERASTFWSCYSCSVAPVLPKWGGKRVTNTCPVDNFLAAFIIMQTKFPKFTDVIRNRKSCNNYEDEICYFLDDCLTASNAKDLTNKKEEFILRNYSTRTKDKNKINLWGSEHSVFFENLLSTCGVIVDFECDECGNKVTNESPRFHTYFNDFTVILHPADAVQSVFNLQYCTGVKTCPNCLTDMRLVAGRFAKPAPWILPIKLESIQTGLSFGLNQLASLPLTVIHEGFTYLLAGITFYKNHHFRSILAVPGGYIVYDGMEDDAPPVVSFNEAVENMAEIGGLIQTILYLKTTKPKKKSQQSTQ